MRNAFADEMTQLAAQDPSIVLLSGDIGNRLFDQYKQQHSERFLNCGVAEANMIGMAAGMALAGLRPVVYTIATFLTYRPFEQIRVDIGYHDLPVVLVGVGGGLSYASNGGTHQAMEDIAVMRAIPGMQVLSAGDAWEVRAGLKAAIASDRPTYLRIGKKGEPLVHSEPIVDFKIGKAISLKEGTEAHILVSGNLLPSAQEAVDILESSGIKVGLHSFHTIEPLDHSLLESLFASGKPIFAIEEHNRNGGLGTAILEWANDNSHDTRLLHRIAAPNSFLHCTANQREARELMKLSPEGIATSIQDSLNP